MGKPTGFKEFDREVAPYRNTAERLVDFKEIYTDHDDEHLQTQGSRCMDCGVPFCQSGNGCPIHNLIPEWNDLVYKGRWREALDRLHKTNNFPEFTGRVCPAPCEGACVLGITDPPVTIKNMESAIIDRGFTEGWVVANPPSTRTGKKVAVIGSGPCGLSAAAQLNTAGHQVTVYERADRLGGLLMYGIPNMKLEKSDIERRVQLMRDEGIEFIVSADVGNNVDVKELVDGNDAVLLATGATLARDLPIPGREAEGVHLAMDFLTANTKSLLDSNLEDGNYISAKDKNVIVIGGGDTGTDCIGTSLRQGAKSIINFELMSQPPEHRSDTNPWPEWPVIFRVDYGHEESNKVFGNDPRRYQLLTKAFLKDSNGDVKGIKTINVDFVDGKLTEIDGTEKTWDAELVLLSMGFLSPEHYLSDDANIELDERGNYQSKHGEFNTSRKGVFSAGDCRRGQSLVVWAINEGRGVANSVNSFLLNS